MDFSKLHIYAQPYFHTDSFIVGNKEALIELKKAIEEALNSSDGKAECESSVADGEGYDCRIILLNDDKQWDKLRRPYTDDYAKDNRKDAINPHELWYDSKK